MIWGNAAGERKRHGWWKEIYLQLLCELTFKELHNTSQLSCKLIFQSSIMIQHRILSEAWGCPNEVRNMSFSVTVVWNSIYIPSVFVWIHAYYKSEKTRMSLKSPTSCNTILDDLHSPAPPRSEESCLTLLKLTDECRPNSRAAKAHSMTLNNN